MRVGTAHVRMGGIAGVGTDDRHRNRGYARRVLENSTDWMTENRFDCAVLFGIPDFYDRFGYAVCLPDCQYVLRTRNAERAAATLLVRPFVAEDRGAVLEIYAANNAEQSGSLVRDDKTPLFQKGSDWGRAAEAVVFTDSAGKIQAYAARDKDHERLCVCEAGVCDLRYTADVARWAASHAVELRCERITFMMPAESKIGVQLTRFGAEQRLTFHRNSDGMGRILNLCAFLAAIAPELARRVKHRPGIVKGDSVSLETDLGAAALTWSGEAIEVRAGDTGSCTVTLPQWRLMQLAMGYYDALDALALPDVEAHGDMGLFCALFPRSLPYMWTADHF